MAKKKVKKKIGTAIWIDEVGSIRNRQFSLMKRSKDREEVLIGFSKKEFYWIKKSNIRGGKTIIYKKSDGEIVSQNPDGWGRIDLKENGIKTLRFNLQNSSLEESKSAIYRWTAPKDIVDKVGPIFKLMFICITVGVLGWSALKFGGLTLEAVTKSRLMDCQQLLPKIVNPIGAVINNTIPIGAT